MTIAKIKIRYHYSILFVRLFIYIYIYLSLGYKSCKKNVLTLKEQKLIFTKCKNFIFGYFGSLKIFHVGKINFEIIFKSKKAILKENTL